MSTTTQLETRQSAAPEAPEAYELAESPGRVLGSTPPDDEPKNLTLDRKTIMKLTSAGFCFFVAGVNDGSVGALVPYVIREYGVNTAIVSSV